MVRVLLTGGSGFIAAHVLDNLLEHGHSVVTTVRSQQKADKIREAHPGVPESKLAFAIVPDIAQPDAFDEAVKSDPPFEAVIHTASPFHFNAQDIQKDLLDPAIIGTTGILKSIKKSAPTVKKVVITSSFASIMDITKPLSYTFSEADWNPITQSQALENATNGYLASKTFAEKAAWKFLEEEKPNFALSTICPPMVYGPIVNYLNSLSALNTSNQTTANIAAGEYAGKELPPTAFPPWVDVRDVAKAHVLAMEKEEANGQRFFTIAGWASNKDVALIIAKNFPELKERIPEGEKLEPGALGEWYGVDNSKSKKVLGLEYASLETSITDTVNSIKSFLQ
ncbi:methylglyoxal reductase (NADPH-dependent) gre2 [Ascosphaera atra]|nr:methylglyoxal reductase (NADPH-dependent) gre2 [Ascosphaera atra]